MYYCYRDTSATYIVKDCLKLIFFSYFPSALATEQREWFLIILFYFSDTSATYIYELFEIVSKDIFLCLRPQRHL